MPPKKRPAGEDAHGEELKKRATNPASTTAAKSVNIAAPGTVTSRPGTTAKVGATVATSKPGTVRGTPKPGIRKVAGAATLANRARLHPSSGTVVKKEPSPPPVITKNTLMWFRNDLRLQDNRALDAASKQAKIGDKKCLVALYIISESEWESHDEAPVKIDFWMRNLAELKKALDKLNIPLIVKRAGAKSDVVGLMESVIKELDISHVCWNAEYMVDERKRDIAVKKALVKLPGVYVAEYEDQCVAPPKEIQTKTLGPFTAFEPFSNAWRTRVETNPQYLRPSDMPEANPVEAKQLYAQYFREIIPSSHTHSLERAEIERLYPAGEEAAQARLREFMEKTVLQYHTIRDRPYEQGSNPLNPYIASGILSIRQCVSAARAANNNKIMIGNEGVKTWITEIIWKEFYRHILVSFPRVCKNRAFDTATENIRWSNDDRKFQMWCQGKTGYPIVDAGMRQLNTLGCMHSRVRMIVACFLVKDLMIDWQKGEKYFMHNLIDGDMASNNGGWQWCASTGAEAQPYYRIFNPLQQSQRFDPNGDYIRQWVPELRKLSNAQIHDPYHALSAKDFGKLAYPKPIVDHAEAKKKFVDEYKRVLAQK
ncbi:hypothetical protein BGX28_005182 [Mortierella sp. GBA30]|nr:hypothetical protein BGX28_005182 [Mortierella sp. GBA30]